MIKKQAFSCSLSIIVFITLVLSCSNLIPKKVLADSAVHTINVDRVPFIVVYNPDNNNVYVSSFGSNTISVINSSSNTVISTISVGNGSSAIAYNPQNHNMYVTNSNSNTISVINSSSNTVISTISVGTNPVNIAYNPSNNNMYIVNEDSNTISVINSSSNTVISTISVGNGPSAIAYNPQNHNMYVTNSNSNTISVINSSSNTVISTISVGNGPSAIAYNPTNYNKHIANLRSNTAPVISMPSTQSPNNPSNDNLLNIVDKMDLNFAIKTSLESTLYQAQRQINDHLNQNSANCNIFNSFIKEVDVFQISGQISNTQALELKQQATSILKGFGCNLDINMQTHWNHNTNGRNFDSSTFINDLSINPLNQLMSGNNNNNNNHAQRTGTSNFGNVVNNGNPSNSFFNTYENIR